MSEKFASRLRFLTPISIGLFVGRFVSEWLQPGALGAILITILASIIFYLALQRLPWYPGILSLLLLAYVFYPEANPTIAISIIIVTIIAYLLVLKLPLWLTDEKYPAKRFLWRIGTYVLTLPVNTIANISITLFFLVLYIITLAPDILPADSGEFQLVAAELGIAHPPGFPLYTLLAHLMTRLPLSATPAYKVNLFSAITGASTLLVVFAIVFKLRKSNVAAATSAIALGASTTFWAQSTTANIRSLTVLFSALVIYILASLHQQKVNLESDGAGAHTSKSVGRINRMKTLLICFTLCLSFGITHHASSIFMGLVFGLYLLLVTPRQLIRYWRWLSVAALGGLIPLLYLLWRGSAGAIGAPEDLLSASGFVNHVLALGFRGDFFYYIEPTILWERLRIMGDIMLFQFSPLLLALMLIGAVFLLRRDRLLFFLLIGAFSVHLFITATYRAPQTVEYLMPAYVPAVIVLGLGLGDLRIRQKQLAFRRDVWSRLETLGIATFVALSLISTIFQIIDRYPSYAWLHNNTDTRTTTEQYLENAPMNSIILADWHWTTPLWYLQTVEDKRPDVDTIFVFPGSIPYGETWANRIADELDQGHPVISTHFDVATYRNLPLAEPFGEWYLFRQEPLETIPADFQPLDIVMGKLVHILGFSTPSSVTEIDQELVIDIAWRPLQNNSERVSLFLHLVSPDGDLLAAQDKQLPDQAPDLSITQFRLTPLAGAMPGDINLVIGAYTKDRLAAESGQTAVVIARHLLIASTFPPFTNNTLHRPVTDSDDGAILVGFDWDQSLPGRHRLYLHWRSPNGYFTLAKDVTGNAYTLPDWVGPWGLTRSGTQLKVPDSESYVPLGQGIVWLGDKISANDQLTPGQSVALQPVFGGGRPVLRDLTVSIRLVGYQQDGVLWEWWDLDDSVPAMGAIPTLKWIRGSRVRSPDWPRVSDDAWPGQEVGPLLLLYDAFTGQVLPIRDDQFSVYQSIPMGRTSIEQ